MSREALYQLLLLLILVTATGLQVGWRVGCEGVYPTCCTRRSTTLSLASSLESSWKQSSTSPEDTVSREWLGGNTRLKRLFSTWGGAPPHTGHQEWGWGCKVLVGDCVLLCPTYVNSNELVLRCECCGASASDSIMFTTVRVSVVR